MKRLSYISLALSIGLILIAGTEEVKTARYDMLNQASWAFMYLFGALYCNHVLRLIFTGLSVLATFEFRDEMLNANNTLNMWEYLIVLVVAAWCCISFNEGRKAYKKLRERAKS